MDTVNFDPADWTYWYVPGEGWFSVLTVEADSDHAMSRSISGFETYEDLQADAALWWRDAHEYNPELVLEVVNAR